jgi:hypothetical protein
MLHRSERSSAAPHAMPAYHGGSMLGTLRPGDQVVIELAPFTAIRPGDAVTFRPTTADDEKNPHCTSPRFGVLTLFGTDRPRCIESLPLLIGSKIMHHATTRKGYSLAWPGFGHLAGTGRRPHPPALTCYEPYCGPMDDRTSMVVEKEEAFHERREEAQG